MEFDLVVHGAGRTPELAGLNLEPEGIDWDECGVQVAGHLQSGRPVPTPGRCSDCSGPDRLRLSRHVRGHT